MLYPFELRAHGTAQNRMDSAAFATLVYTRQSPNQRALLHRLQFESRRDFASTLVRPSDHRPTSLVLQLLLHPETRKPS